MIPLLHDFEGTTVLVFGGGAVGARKARKFTREARVIVVSPLFADVSFGGAQLVRAAPRPNEIPGWIDRASPALVVAATDDEAVNEAAVAAATEAGALVNRADEAGSREPHNVVVPATIRDDPVVVSVSTGGHSPALSKTLREWFQEDLHGVGQMAELTGEIRTELKDRGVAPPTRREAVRTLTQSSRVWKALRAGNDNVKQVADDVIEPIIQREES
jgi:precorrin-2 dehydrogenase/sirohydrochlorin ferrochelatase